MKALSFGFCLLFSSPSQAGPTQPSPPSPDSWLPNIIGHSNEDIRIGGHFGLDGHCRVVVLYTYNLINPPSHGDVCFRIERSTVKDTGDGSQKCTGLFVVSRVVYYKAFDNYVGVDRFTYDVLDWNKIVLNVDAGLTILSDPSVFESSQAVQSAEPLDKIQRPGPILECEQPVS